jgi:hypothetical protein
VFRSLFSENCIDFACNSAILTVVATRVFACGAHIVAKEEGIMRASHMLLAAALGLSILTSGITFAAPPHHSDTMLVKKGKRKPKRKGHKKGKKHARASIKRT